MPWKLPSQHTNAWEHLTGASTNLSDFFLYMPHGEVNIYTSYLIEFIKYILLNNTLYYTFLV